MYIGANYRGWGFDLNTSIKRKKKNRAGEIEEGDKVWKRDFPMSSGFQQKHVGLRPSPAKRLLIKYDEARKFRNF